MTKRKSAVRKPPTKASPQLGDALVALSRLSTPLKDRGWAGEVFFTYFPCPACGSGRLRYFGFSQTEYRFAVCSECEALFEYENLSWLLLRPGKGVAL